MGASATGCAPTAASAGAWAWRARSGGAAAAPPAHATVRLGRSGRPTLVCGFQDIGTGTMTACAVIVAESIGVSVDAVRVQAGDTAGSGYGPTSGGSMTLASVAPAVRSAAHHVRVQLLDLASDMFEISASDLVLRDGAVTLARRHAAPRDHRDHRPSSATRRSSGTGHAGPTPTACGSTRSAARSPRSPSTRSPGNLTVERVWAVHDVGRIINPMGAMSQVTGGILQAVGFALSEERVVDPTTGTVVNPGFEDYKVPTMADTPEIVCEFVDRPDPHLALGREGPRRASHHPHRRGDRKRLRPRDRGAAAPGAVHPAAGARGARGAGPVRAFAYSRPESAAAAAERLRAPGARAMGGGTDLLTQLQRGIRPADEVVDLRGAGLEGIEVAGEGLRIGAATRIADVARHPDVTARFAVLAQAAAAVGSPQLREMGTVAGNLCQAVRCWYLPPSRPDLLAARRRHLLRPDRRPPQARPRAGRLHLGGAVRPGRGPAGAGRDA